MQTDNTAEVRAVRLGGRAGQRGPGQKGSSIGVRGNIIYLQNEEMSELQ